MKLGAEPGGDRAHQVRGQTQRTAPEAKCEGNGGFKE